MNRIVETELNEYEAGSPEARTHALREVLQRIALYALAMDGFFRRGVFHGGTELRLIDGLPRFSEDLDFILSTRDGAFSWEQFTDALASTFKHYGMEVTLQAQATGKSSIRRLLLSEPSILGPALRGRIPHLRIRFEVDVEPPAGARLETAFLDFPLPFEVAVMDLPSSFSLKCHALLCRPWVKGRDWFDLLWFCSRDVHPLGEFLGNAFREHGPWAGSQRDFSGGWLREQLTAKVRSIDLASAAREVAPFLSIEDRGSLGFWGAEFFERYIDRIRLE